MTGGIVWEQGLKPLREIEKQLQSSQYYKGQSAPHTSMQYDKV